MRQSNLFTKTQKKAPSSEDSINAKLLNRAGFISKQAAGVYNYLPLGLLVIKNIENIIREELNNIGAQEILMPVLTQEESWKQTKRDGLDILFKTENFVLNPTHEEVITPLMKKYISSYRDLPIAAYQLQVKFRNEPRAKSGLLRGREFLMKDMYSFHKDEKDLENFYLETRKAYHKIYDRLGIGDITIWTYASGGSFSKYSHEFQTLSNMGEDKIYLCDKCNIAINNEIEHEKCPQCNNDNLEQKRSIEVGNIFKLKTKFSKAFDLKYKDEKGDEILIPMGCYGLGISRAMGAIVEVFHDKKGIVWPSSIAPFKVHLLEIDKSAEKIYKKFDNILYDDRKNVSAGEKMAEADLIGIPIRAIVSKKAGKKIEVKQRNSNKTKLVSIQWLKKQLTKN